VACSKIAYVSEAESMLAQSISRLIAACTSSSHIASSAAILVGYAVRIGWRLNVAAPQRVSVTTFFGWVAMAVLVAIVLLTACSRPTPTQQVTLRIGILRIQDDLPYFVMQEQGFAKQHGLQLVETLYQSGAAIVAAVGAGAVDVGADVGTVPILAAAERGLVPRTVVPVGASYFVDADHPSIAMLTAPSVNTWQDLEGQFVAVNGKNSLSATAMQGRLRQEGVHDVKLTEISFADMGLAVAGGNVAAAVMSEPWLTQSLLRGDGKLLDWVIGGRPFEHIEGAMIIFKTDFYQNNPQAVKAFLRAQLQAVTWINRHPDGARSILARRLGLSQEVAQKVRLPRWSLNARHDPILLESMQPMLVEIGLLKAPVPVNQLYDETLLKEVLAEKR
jgi:NitT/TauT family transport system substrate-binding protein